MQDLRVRPRELGPDPNLRQEEDEKLRKACREFESVFTHEILKSMRRTVEKCDLFHGGQGEEMYESLLDQELSKNMAGSGPGSLAAVLYRQLRKEKTVEPLDKPDPTPWKDLTVPAAPLKPLSEGVLSSAFGWRKDPFSGEDRFHHGVDLAAPEGTPVRAPMNGKVLRSEYTEGYGHVVVVDHGQGLTTLYAHNRENMVSEGDWVRKGTPLARVGSSGRSTGPHLHFEVKRDGKPLDPRLFLEESLTG